MTTRPLTTSSFRSKNYLVGIVVFIFLYHLISVKHLHDGIIITNKEQQQQAELPPEQVVVVAKPLSSSRKKKEEESTIPPKPQVINNQSIISSQGRGGDPPQIISRNATINDKTSKPPTTRQANNVQSQLQKTKYNLLEDPWVEDRQKLLESFYAEERDEEGRQALRSPADDRGPVLDFLVVGWPKCGTTTLEANLGAFAPMPVADICTPMNVAVWNAYTSWPKTYGADKLLRGNKCPNYVDHMLEITTHLPKTKLIFGIRHPVTWFQSFWNMLARNDSRYSSVSPYNKTKPCKRTFRCRNQCPDNQLLCIYRSQFHTALARLGKTPLSDEERQYLAPDQFYGGKQLENFNVSNPIFVYELSQMKDESFWDELADFLDIPAIPNDKYHGSHGHDRKWGDKYMLDICDPQYDNLRKLMMPISYELFLWLDRFFRPVALDPSRRDVKVPNADKFFEKVGEFSKDPCGRLERQEDGSFDLITEYKKAL